MVAYRFGRCAYCCRERRLFARGLCSKCYTTPSIRVKFPAKLSGRKRLTDSTEAVPGRFERVEALAELANERKPLFGKRRD